jgi:hypothetical protein
MFIHHFCNSTNFVTLIRKIVLTKIWKKKFSSLSFIKCLKSIINFTLSGKKISYFKNIDFKLYMFFIKFEDYYNSPILIKLFQLQEESLIIQIISILLQKFNYGIEIFYLFHCKWKNDLRLNKNMKYLFEKYNKYINRTVNSIFQNPPFCFLFKDFCKLRKILKKNIFFPKYTFLSRKICRSNLIFSNIF